MERVQPAELRQQIALTLIPQVGPQTARQLLASLGSLEAVFHASPQELERIPDVGPTIAKNIVGWHDTQAVEAEIRYVEENGIQTLFFMDEDYPARLKDCPDAPILLYYKGQNPFPSGRHKWLSIVGTRRATSYGADFVQSLLRDLAPHYQDLIVVSGLADGIDGLAHRAALDNGIPTIGVLGHGLDMVYPAAHRDIARQMQAQGGLLTEYTHERRIDRNFFLQRNRIIAGLSQATLVVESAVKGGAMVTAANALSYGREVLALPGTAGRTISGGCNLLIKTHKASLIECAEDLETALGWKRKTAQQSASQPTLFYTPTAEEAAVIGIIRHDAPIAIDELIRAAKLPINTLNSILLSLEFQGVIRKLPGRVYETTS